MYEDIMNGHNIFFSKILVEVKDPTIDKIFMFFLNRKDLLRKDNLDKRNGLGVIFLFCDSKENIEHFVSLMSISFVQLIWHIVFFGFNITHYQPISLYV
jgi:hypothetical protein